METDSTYIKWTMTQRFGYILAFSSHRYSPLTAHESV